MKYRIVELESGKFRVQMKYGIFDCWGDSYSDYKELSEAR